MNFWTSFSFITNEITHSQIPLSTLGNDYSIFRTALILEHKIWKCQEKKLKNHKIICLLFQWVMTLNISKIIIFQIILMKFKEYVLISGS
jgi:hypothetical protein